MKATRSIFSAAAMAAALALGVFGTTQITYASPRAGIGQDAAGDAQAKLNKSQFKNVKVAVDNGIATLTGTVSLYEYKKDAANRVRKAKGVTAVRNDIEVIGSTANAR